MRLARNAGHKVARAHLRHLNPLPSNTGEVLKPLSSSVLLPELNLGQLALVLRGKFLVDIVSFNQLRGLPFHTQDLFEAIEGMVAIRMTTTEPVPGQRRGLDLIPINTG